MDERPNVISLTSISSAQNFHSTINRLSLRLKRFWKQSHVPLDRPLVPQELHICSVNLDLTLGALLEVLVTAEGSKTPVLGDDDLLATRELVLRAAEGFDGCRAV